MKLIDDNFGCTDEVDSNGVDWYGCFSTFYCFIVDIIATMIIFSSYAVLSCDVSSVCIITASALSHKHRQPGVSLCALSTVLLSMCIV